MSAKCGSFANGWRALDVAAKDDAETFARHSLDWRVLADGTPPPREWANRVLARELYVTLLAGLGGIGKTLLAQMIGSACALGREFLGAVHTPRRVLGWFAEDDHDELWRRQLAIAQHFGVGLGDFAGKLVVESFADRDSTLMDLDLGARLGRHQCTTSSSSRYATPRPNS